jgi:hypothetical protein
MNPLALKGMGDSVVDFSAKQTDVTWFDIFEKSYVLVLLDSCGW